MNTFTHASILKRYIKIHNKLSNIKKDFKFKFDKWYVFVLLLFTYFYILSIKPQFLMNNQISFIDLFSKVDSCCWSNFGHSHNTCLTVIITLHSDHSGAWPCGLLIKWPCVRRVWPILRRVRITCACLL